MIRVRGGLANVDEHIKRMFARYENCLIISLHVVLTYDAAGFTILEGNP